MSFKKIGKIVGAAIGSFLVIIAATYFLYSYLNSETNEDFSADQSEVEQFDFDPDDLRTEAGDSLENRVGELQNSVDSLKALEQEQRTEIDSLNDYIAQLEQEKAKAEEAASKEVTAEDLKDVSRSLLDLDEDSLTPILNRLSTKQLTGLYNSASNMQRAKLLRSVEPDKAATILNEVM